MALKNAYLIDLMSRVEARNPNDKQFLITVRSVLESIEPVVEKHPEYVKAGVLELFVEQERVIKFRVPWVDDKGNVHVNRGYRVQGNSAIGPYKGGLRLHPSVTEACPSAAARAAATSTPRARATWRSCASARAS